MTEAHETPNEGYAPLRLLHESVVRPEEIDALGHMNVRFYGARALASTARLLGELGVDADDFGAAAAVVHDMPCLFTRYHHEQHTGSSLEVRGGLVRVSEDAVRLYHELRNPKRDELAASFVHDIRFRVSGEDTPLLLPSSVLKELSRSLSKIPEAGRPRTIDLDGAPVAPSLSEALESGLAFRLPRRVEADDCDGEGRLSAEMRPFYMWGGDPIPPEKLADGPSLIPLAGGGKMGWASMETRSVMIQQPVSGMRIQAFAATVALARKTNLRRYWVFDLDTEHLLLSNEVVELALHLGQRRAIEIPAEIREEMLTNLRDDLR